MNRVCLLCDRAAPASELFCQEPCCQAERAPLVLAYGDRLGDVEVVRPLVALRSSMLYEAIHIQQRVFLKVAHPGREHEARLAREAALLRSLQPAERPARPGLPTLLSPYTRANAHTSLVGRAMLADRLVSYTLLAHIPGEPLQDVLAKYPQLWIDHIGWITIELASAVALMHGAHHLHLALGPECVFVHFAGGQGIPRVTLLDLGLVATLRESADGRAYAEHWYPEAARPSATAPELLRPTAAASGVVAGPAADVYGLGLVLYELLAGAPPFPRSQVVAPAVAEQVVAGRLRPLNRADVPPIGDLVLRMLSRDPRQRPLDAPAIVEELKGTEIGLAPIVKQGRWPATEQIFRVAAVVLFAAFVIALLFSLSDLFHTLTRPAV